MRQGHNFSWMIDDNGNLMGVNLGSDFTAEHEWGIKGLKWALKCVDNNEMYGLERRRCKPNPKNVLLREDNGVLTLMVAGDHSVEHHSTSNLNKVDEWNIGNREMLTAWNEGGCLIRVRGEDNHKKLRRIHEALLAGDCAVWLGGGFILENAGLCIGIISQIEEKYANAMRDADVEVARLNEASLATGIQAKIDEANEHWQQMTEVETGQRCYGKKWGYYALSPRWLGNGKKSKYKVMYLLNPEDQESNNWGTYTVEELEQWLEGKGPIPKQVKKVRR